MRGPRPQCGSISVTDDILVEEDETVTVMAAFVQSSPEISLVSNTATITITDNDCKDINCMLCMKDARRTCNIHFTHYMLHTDGGSKICT